MKKYLSIVLMFLFLAVLLWDASAEEKALEREDRSARQSETHTKAAGVFAAFQEKIIDTEILSSVFTAAYEPPEKKESEVYTFLQGPRSYSEGLPWSGDWCEKIVGYHKFGGFGCGFCCMANIYSTLTDYECSPWDMFEFAVHATSYYPSRESGAIGWDDMKATLKAAGFSCKNRLKPKTYKKFKQQMKKAQSAIVLVSSANDSTFWTDTPGHYVNIWLYQEDTDMVFLAEPGDPEHNRTWIPLRYVYDALKTVSQYQYLTVSSYSEEKNQWKLNGIDDIWNGKSPE